MPGPGFLIVDGEGAALRAADVLLGRADLPGQLETSFEKPGRDGSAQDRGEVRNLAGQLVENRYDLSGMAEAMA